MAGYPTNAAGYVNYGNVPDPSAILNGTLPNFALNTTPYSGPYGQAVRSVLSLLKGPNVPAMAGTQAATQQADQSSEQYQTALDNGNANFASRGLSGSGPQVGMVSNALQAQEGSVAGAGQAGNTMTQQMRQQLQMQILQQLQAIAAGRAQSQYGIQSSQIGLNNAENAANSQKLGEFGSIFNTGLGLLNFKPQQGSILGSLGGLFSGSGSSGLDALFSTGGLNPLTDFSDPDFLSSVLAFS